MNRRFLHSGKYGDLIYSLWTIKALGGGSILFNLSEGSLTNEEGFRFCSSLLETLPYISSVETIKFRKSLENKRGEKLFCRQDYENPDLLILDNAWYWRNYPETCHWIYRYAYTFGVQVDASEAMIKLPVSYIERPIIIQYTDRYVGSRIPEHFLARGDVIVIEDGSCGSMLELATLIASSKFFVGNQSVGAALAQALQHPRLIEKPSHPFWQRDAYPIGKHGFLFDSDFDVKLENVLKASEEFWNTGV